MAGRSQPASRWMERISGAVRRRAVAWRRTFGGPPPALSATKALSWLEECATRGNGLAPTCGSTAVCPGLTAAAIPTLLNFGRTETALSFAYRLLAIQARDGSVPDAGLLHTSIFNTAQTVRAWRTLLDADLLPEALPALRKACGYLVSRIADDGSLRFPAGGGSFERWSTPAVQLAGFSELLAAARRFQMPQWRLALARAVDRVARRDDASVGQVASHVMAHGVEALLELAEVDARCEYLARRALDQASACLTSDGALPVDLAHEWTSSAGLAHFAALWFRAGDHRAGAAAMRQLARRQTPTGGWTGSWGRGAAFFPNHGSAWTAKFALDAQRLQVATAFADAPATLLESPADEDARLRLVLDLADDVVSRCGPQARIADVGCGSGRFLSRIAESRPRLQLTGIDPSPALLEHLPQHATGLPGDLLRLPAADGSFDAAFCIEALEHALVPERAVAELCRVVRPGGRVVIIDKDARFQSLSLTEPWEQWFAPQSLMQQLAEHCDNVCCAPLPSGPQQQTPGLFLCWSGTKKAVAATTIAPPQRRAA